MASRGFEDEAPYGAGYGPMVPELKKRLPHACNPVPQPVDRVNPIPPKGNSEFSMTVLYLLKRQPRLAASAGAKARYTAPLGGDRTTEPLP